MPAALRIVVIEVIPACHHRRWSLRSSRVITAGLSLFSARRDARMSNRVQSFAWPEPDDASAKVRRTRSCWSGPRDEELAAPAWPAEDELGCEGLMIPASAAAAGTLASASAAAASSSSPRSFPPGSCACRSVAGTPVALVAGERGCLPLRLVEVPLPGLDVNLHSPGM